MRAWVAGVRRRVRGIHKGIYQASARAYWLSPQLIGTIGRRRAQDQLGLGYLLNLVEEVQTDLAGLEQGDDPPPTLGVSGEIRLAPDKRQAFLDDLRATLQDLFTPSRRRRRRRVPAGRGLLPQGERR